MAFKKKMFDIKAHPDLMARIEGLEMHGNNLINLKAETRSVLGDTLERMMDHFEIRDPKLRALLAMRERGISAAKIRARADKTKMSDAKLKKLLALREPNIRIPMIRARARKIWFKKDDRIDDKIDLLTASFTPLIVHINSIYRRPSKFASDKAVREIFSGSLQNLRKWLELKEV